MTSLDELKQRAAVVWGAAPFERLVPLIAPLHDELVSRLEPRAGERWLDVATGTGAVALRAAREGAEVTGIDIAPALVATARRLAEAEGLSIRFDVGDAETLPYEDESFDVVSSSLGAIFAPDHDAVARELARVSRPGGRLGLIAWGPNPEWDAIMADYRPPGPPAAGDPGDWGREEYVRERLDGDFELVVETRTHYWDDESGEAAWQEAIASCGPLKTMVENLEPDRREEFHHRWVSYQERFRTDGRVRVPQPYLLVVGRRR